MPVTEGKYQCTHCDDIFSATSGTYTKCKCGESEIDPHYFGYSYKNGNKVKTIESNSYYLEDEFVKLAEDIEVIYNEIKQIKEANGYKYYLYEMTEKGKDGERFLSQINLEYSESVSKYSREKNEISLTIRLKEEDYKGGETTKVRLQRFLSFMKSIEAGEIDISKRSDMIKLADKEDIYYTEEPTGDTDYTFYL
jgi:uncharacterized LabA/DUF88 family protein